MNRLEGESRRHSFTGGSIGGMGYGNTAELGKRSTRSDHEESSCSSTTGHNTPISRPQDQVFKADFAPLVDIRDAKSNVPLSEEEYLGLATPKLNDINTGGMMHTCSSKFQVTSRSHSFGGPTADHNGGFFLEREGEATTSRGRSNPSLQYLITRARRGLGRPYSANASPLSYNGGRRHVSIDLSPHQHRRDLANAIADLQSFQAECQPDCGDDSIRQAIADVTNHCLRQTAESTAETSSSSFLSGDRLKRNQSSEAKINSSAFPTEAEQRGGPTEARSKSRRLSIGSEEAEDAIVEGRSKSRRLSHCTSVASEAEEEDTTAASSEETQSHRNSLRLPDPDNLADRRQLFAMSRKMCSQSSIQAFESDLEEMGDDSDMRASAPQSSRQRLQNISVAPPASAQECKMSTPCTMRTPVVAKVPAVELSVGTASTTAPLHDSSDMRHDDDDDVLSFSSSDSIMSVEEDNDAADCESMVSSTLSSSAPPQMPLAVVSDSPKVDDDDDDDSIAFSMDSIHMRKQQFDHHHSSPTNSPLCGLNRSTRTLNQSARTLLTDWAVNGQSQVPAVKGTQPSPAPPQQIVCEFGLPLPATAMMMGDEDSIILQQRFQMQARLGDDDGSDDQDEDQEDNDDDCTLASLSSLGTAPVAERMEEMDP